MMFPENVPFPQASGPGMTLRKVSQQRVLTFSGVGGDPSEVFGWGGVEARVDPFLNGAPVGANILAGAAVPAVDAVTEEEVAVADVPVQPNVRCAIYARCATRKPTKPDPLAAQIDACEAYAAGQGWTTVEVYRDLAVNDLTASRTGLFAMLAAADRGEFDVILVEDLARLSRRASDLLGIMEEMEALGIDIHTFDGGAIGILEAMFKVTMIAKFEKEKAARIRRRRDHAVDRKPPSSRGQTGHAGVAS